MTFVKLGSLRCRVNRSHATAPVLVMLHGRGADSSDLDSLAGILAPGWTRVVPDAPRPWPEKGLRVGLCWYQDPGRANEIEESRGALLETIAAVRKQGDGGPLVLAGFSQGAVMTLATGLDEPGLAVGLIALSGYLDRERGSSASPPTLVIHGTHDEVVAIDRGRQAARALEARRVPITFREYPMGHEIVPDLVPVIRSFLKESASR